jgi:hypothetical protein
MAGGNPRGLIFTLYIWGGVGVGVRSKGRVAQIGSFEKKIVQKVAMVC